MKTEDLNEYIFTMLVDEFAQRVRRNRINDLEKQLKSENREDDAIYDLPITPDDLKQGFDLLLSRHKLVVGLLKEVNPALVGQEHPEQPTK